MDKPIKTTITIQLPIELAERIKDIAYWVPEYTLTSLVCEALNEKIKYFTDISKRPQQQLARGRKII